MILQAPITGTLDLWVAFLLGSVPVVVGIMWLWLRYLRFPIYRWWFTRCNEYIDVVIDAVAPHVPYYMTEAKLPNYQLGDSGVFTQVRLGGREYHITAREHEDVLGMPGLYRQHGLVKHHLADYPITICYAHDFLQGTMHVTDIRGEFPASVESLCYVSFLTRNPEHALYTPGRGLNRTR